MNIWLFDMVKIMQVKRQVTGVALLLYKKEQLLKAIQRHQSYITLFPFSDTNWFTIAALHDINTENV